MDCGAPGLHAAGERSAEPDTHRVPVRRGLRDAGVEVEADERRPIVEEIDDVERDETQDAPEVGSAPSSGDPEG